VREGTGRRRASRAAIAAAAALGLASARAAVAQNSLDESSNWSGYDALAPSGSFTDVAATWVIPSVAGSPDSTYSSYWVGFDGVSDSTVEQCGVSAQVSASGAASYNAWYEFAPAAEIEVSLAVHAGDMIYADATYEGLVSGKYDYDFYIDDETTGKSFDQVETTKKNDARSSAEWIAEAPSLGSSITNLADFHGVTFTGAVATLNGTPEVVGALSPDENEMVQTNGVVALPTSMASSDSAFNVIYEPTSLFWNNTNAYGPSDGMTWDFAGNNNWNTGSVNAAYADGDAVTFNDNNNGNYAVTLNSYFVHPASVTVNSTGNYTISGSGHISGTGALTKSGSGTLTLSTTNSYTGGTNVTGGWLVIEPTGSTSALPEGAVNLSGTGELQLADNVTAGTQSSDVPVTAPTSNVILTSLAISGSGTLDIGNNHIIVDYSGADPISSIAGWIADGYSAGSWTGTGITSSAAQLNSSSYGIGYADAADAGNPAGLSSGQIEIMYTLLGDANLDGKVDGADFALMAVNFNDAVTNGWDQGDFNYDGTVNGADFVLLANNFNQFASQSSVAADDLAAVDSFAASNGITLTSVPEPVSGTMILVMAGGAVAKRRRHRKV